MLNMKKFLLPSIAVLAIATVVSCKHVEEEPEINLGYKKNIRVPDAEPMTAEDSVFVAAQKAEYEQNAK